jgi:iron complex transport system permease protein
MLFKTTNMRVLIPGAMCCGSLLALIAGLFPASIPLNAVLSLVGVPVILYVMLRGSGRS